MAEEDGLLNRTLFLESRKCARQDTGQGARDPDLDAV